MIRLVLRGIGGVVGRDLVVGVAEMDRGTDVIHRTLPDGRAAGPLLDAAGLEVAHDAARCRAAGQGIAVDVVGVNVDQARAAVKLRIEVRVRIVITAVTIAGHDACLHRRGLGRLVVVRPGRSGSRRRYGSTVGQVREHVLPGEAVVDRVVAAVRAGLGGVPLPDVVVVPRAVVRCVKVAWEPCPAALAS